MSGEKTIGFVFVERFADWEYGLLAASAVEWFGASAVAMSPGGKAVRSISGFRVCCERGLDQADTQGLDALVIVGSDRWMDADAPDLRALMTAVARGDGVVGGICGGTLALARAGLFEGHRHTSNGRVWIADHLPHYPGEELYQDVPLAVAHGKIVSAPGAAPASFALAMLAALYPQAHEQLAAMRAIFAREHLHGDDHMTPLS